MSEIPSDIVTVEFNKDGAFVDRTQLDALLHRLTSTQATDLILMSHGWNNDMGEARDLYTGLRTHLAAQLPNVPALAARRFVLAGVLWPSKKFADEDNIPGGAASIGDDSAADETILAQLQTLQEAVDPTGASAEVRQDFDRLRALVPQLDSSDAPALREFATLTAKHLLPDDGQPKEEVDATVPDALRSGDVNGVALLEVLGRPMVVAPPSGGGMGGATSIGDEDDEGGPPAASRGGAAGIGDFFSGVKAGALNLLNVTTYYTMKSRAGFVGQRGVYETLRAVAALPNAPRVHLVGHSFGCRLVSSAVLGPDGQPPLHVGSVTLLQGAFSHYSFSGDYLQTGDPGFFRQVVAGARIGGPLVISHTRNDKAVGVAYAIASRTARQVAAALGDEHDKYGGLGSNGALDTTEAIDEDMHAPGTPYTFAPGSIHNLKADPFIKGHSDIKNDAAAYVILSAVAAAP